MAQTVTAKAASPAKADSKSHRVDSNRDFIEQAVILAPPSAYATNDYPLLNEGSVVAGFHTILRAAHDFNDVATRDLGLSIAE